MSGQWPPEWDDPDDNPPGKAEQQDTETEARLSEVAAYLASVPAPAMPAGVEARISAALAVETAARAGIAPANGDTDRGDTAQADGTAQWDAAVGVRVLRPVPARARFRRREASGRSGRRDGRRPLGRFVGVPFVVCLLLAGFGFLVSHAGGPSSSSSANSVAGLPAAGSAASSAAPASSAAASAPMAVPSAVVPAAGFMVTQSGTRYQQATLAQQARARVLAAKASELGPTFAPSASSAASAGYGAARSYAPGTVLRACVLKVTGGVFPELVDRATYQGTPVYVIASSNRVWVVGLGCTVARPQVIVSVPLAG